MNRGHAFITRFNELEAHLLKMTRAAKGRAFYQLLDDAARLDASVRRHRDCLKDYADLRNAIVHHRTFPGEIIAEPTAETLSKLAAIIEDIEAPRRVIPSFQREIRCFSPDEQLAQALRHMREHDFSQIVVRREMLLTLLTVEGIARWLEQQATDDIISVSDATIGEALAYDVDDAFEVIVRNTTVYEAYEAFASALSREHPRLFAIIITHAGKRTEKPLGIITPWDVMQYRPLG